MTNTGNPQKSIYEDPSAPAHFAWSIERTLREFQTDHTVGLDSEDSKRRLQAGTNELPEEPPEPFWKKLVRQFAEVMIWLLLAAAVISGILGDWIDAFAILAIVFLNAGISLFQEEKAGSALAALRKLSPPLVKVLRSGRQQSLPARELVPGDVVELEAGDNIPADARLVRSFGLQVSEAALTGESTPVEKEADIVLPIPTQLAERRNLVFMGTQATAGKATAIVVGTGSNTELGKIAGLLSRFKATSTPLERRLRQLGKLLIGACLAIVGIVFALQLWRGGNLLEMLVVSISLAVAAVPEGMPAVVTLTLALGLERMVRRNAIVRKLASVETLGSVSVICTDKTGTLTCNEMTVREIYAGGKHYRVTGAGYAPEGEFYEFDRPQGEPVDAASERSLIRTMKVGARCNHAQVNQSKQDGATTIVGDPTEAALLVAALKAGLPSTAGAGQLRFEIPFDSQRKAMSVVIAESGGSSWMYTKGAPEVLLSSCTDEQINDRVQSLTDADRHRILAIGSAMAGRALRVLGLAYRPISGIEQPPFQETNLIFAGLVGMLDPPREEAHRAVLQCRTAGIRAVMITGDHPATAIAIGKSLALTGEFDEVVTGQQLDAMSDTELAAQLSRISVFARVSAEHKLRVVRAFQQQGQIVAMTGDGVNDAPAVKAADVGIAMGLSGSDVTKEAADIVLADDNFASIVSAVEEGRGIFDNIQKFVHYLLSCNAGEVLLMFVAALVGWPVPLTALQLLWINLVTDGLPALALGTEPPERNIMQRPPRKPCEPVLSRREGTRILLHGVLIAGVAVLSFWLTYRGDPENIPAARTVAFCTSAFSQIFFSIACRSQRYTLPELGLFTNPLLFWAIAVSAILQLLTVTTPFGQRIFDAPASIVDQWPLVLGLSLVPATLVEIAKLVRAWRAGPAAKQLGGAPISG